ncbi:MAG: fumarylacetoacetate hydrolase family protein [Planctomycetota bacterium]|jgi:2-keto-4-pentenoate hydratase/2-oxohepta-3-ene-1,7-dioic acid hydratase in catechol pathway
MKLITYSRNGAISFGILADKGVIDVKSVFTAPDAPGDLRELLQKGPAFLAELTCSAEDFLPVDSVKLLAPIPRPPKVLALAGNYSDVPRPFIKPATAVIGPGEEIPWPAYSEQIDYEIELAVVIGKKAKCIEPRNALDFVAGYTICNDVSARSVTFKKARAKRPWDEFYDWLSGKWADGFFPMGPYLLTADQVEDVQNLDMTLTVNGQVRQKANTSQMIYPVADIVSFLSHIITLEPGDVIATGTPAGVAVATGNFLQPGDTIECTIEKLGTLRNKLGQRPKTFYEPLAR